MSLGLKVERLIYMTEGMRLGGDGAGGGRGDKIGAIQHRLWHTAFRISI